MKNIEDLFRLVYAYASERYYSRAQRALERNLKRYIRPEILKDVRLENVLIGGSKVLGDVDDDDRGIFLDDAVGDFISDEKADEMRAILEAKLERIHKIDEDLAESMVSKSSMFTSEQRQQFEKVLGDLERLVLGYISGYVRNKAKQWLSARKKEREQAEEADIEHEVLPDSELMEQERAKAWQEGLIKDIFSHINKTAPKERVYPYKVMLLDRFMAEPSKRLTFKDIEKKTGVPDGTLKRWDRELGRMLASFLSAQGLGPKFVDQGGLYKKDVGVPPYQEVLRKKEDIEDLKDFIKESLERMQRGGSAKGENLEEVLMLLAEGKSKSEIISKGFSGKTVDNVKGRYFNKWYEEWYREMLKDIREACMRIARFLMAQTPMSERVITDAINKKYPLELSVEFSANYDRQDIIKESERVDPEKDPVAFKYESYTVRFKRDKKPRMEYVYKQKLTHDGKFEGSPHSSLTIEGNPGSTELKNKLDEYVENEMKPEGLLPYGPSVKSRQPVRIPVEYINNSLDKGKTYDRVSRRVYRGFVDFFDKYRGFLVADEPHLKRMEQESAREMKKMIPKGGRTKIKKLLVLLSDELSDEKAERNPNRERIKELTERIKELNEHLKKDDEKELTDFISKHEQRFKLAVERLDLVKEIGKLEDLIENKKQMMTGRKMRGAPVEDLQAEIDKAKKRVEELREQLKKTPSTFPKPQSERVLKLFRELSDLQIEDKKMDGFLTPADLMLYANQLQEALAQEEIEERKKIKKDRGLEEAEKEEAYKRLQKHREARLAEFMNLFEALPADLKARLSEYEKTDAVGYKRLKDKHGQQLLWVKEPSGAIGKIKKKLLVPKLLETPKVERKTVVPMEEEAAKGLLNFLEAQLTGFDVIGKRFGDAPLVAGEFSGRKEVEAQLSKNKAELDKIKNQLSGESEMKELRDKIPGYISEIERLKKALYDRDVPALIMARVLGGKVSDFSRLYNPLTKTLWFSPKTFARRAEEKDVTETLQKSIAKDAISLSKQNIFDAASIQALVKSIQSGLSRFKKEFIRTASLPYMTPFERRAVEDEMTKERIRYIFPSAELDKSKKILRELEEKGISSKNAKKELKELVLSIEKAYNEFDRNVIEGLAKKENISYGQAGVRLKKIKDAMAHHAIAQFILKWQEVLDRDLSRPVKEKGPLGRKPSEKYEKVLEILEEDVPELFELVPPSDEFKEPPRGIATPKEIRQRIESEFGGKKFEEKFDFFADPAGATGGGGGKGKKYPGVVKKHPPAYTYEKLRSDFKEALKNKTVHQIVFTPIGSYLLGVRHHIKAGEYFDVDDVVAGVVDILHNFKRAIKSLRVSASPGAGADILLRNEHEAHELFNKFVALYKLVDMIAEPDKIGPISGDLSKVKNPDTWFPAGLMAAFPKEELGKKSASFMAFCLARKFIG